MTFALSRTPTGFHHSAQGCACRAVLSRRSQTKAEAQRRRQARATLGNDRLNLLFVIRPRERRMTKRRACKRNSHSAFNVRRSTFDVPASVPKFLPEPRVLPRTPTGFHHLAQ